MRRDVAALGSTLFFAAAPGIIAGFMPWVIARWDQTGIAQWGALEIAGAVLAATGAAFLINAFARFVLEGAGTPAPIAPPEHLVVGGIYRYVRNPMYLAVLSAIIGQAAMFRAPGLLVYAAFIALAFVTFVKVYEEPTLKARYGAAYDAYRRAVPGWLPRWTPARLP